MEFFRDAYSVRLLCHTGKYLWANEDKYSVSQKRGKDTYGVIWRVELVPDRNAIRLKSVYDLYLMASDYAFLLGATGKKVLQSFASKADSSLEWEPVAAGTFVKLMTKGEKFLRANGGLPPYRSSITHDVPVLASNQHVVLWEVEVVRKKDAPSLTPSRMMSPRQSITSQPKSPPAPQPPQPPAESSDEEDIPVPPPVSVRRPRPRANPVPQPESSDDDDDDTPPPPPAGIHRPRPRANPAPRRRQQSEEDYSPLSSEQGSPPPQQQQQQQRRPSPPSEALRNTRIGRRRGSPPRDAGYDQTPPPRRRDADYAHRAPSFDQSPPPRRPRDDYASSASETSSPGGATRHRPVPAARRLPVREEYESSHSGASTPRRSVDGEEGSARSSVRAKDMRRIFYSVAEDDGEVLAHDDETFGTFMFQGQSLDELTQELQRVTGIRDDIILCMRNPLSAKLYKMRLALPQNNAPLSVVIVRSNSQFGRTFTAQTPRQR
ncbi:hypothetical protein KC19_3G069000 [Ceratodon purpureus]|uniref:DUF569 domain-containing protein n=1 Tax=Ceratodon purpureus TaxID=3225 RepID=A0A8T0IHR6_CERPU|nr:hypothetical protein KC19_3G069000 [Ceratodon purpureus]